MADQEEIIIIEESDAAGAGKASDTSKESSDIKEPIWKSKKFLIIIAATLFVLSLGGGLTFYFLTHHDTPTLDENVSVVAEKPKETIIEPSELEKMIERANYLYANGNPTEALKLYEKIALYSEAISQYNLGVVQLKEGEYSGALANFKRSIANSENRCVSAINAAVCALHLGREKEFNYYIDMASAYLPQESASPLYSYYYALINYYKGRYLEALSALKHPTTDEYIGTQNKIRAKISSLFSSYEDAANALQEPLQEEDFFTLGLLYANMGDLNNAKRFLTDSLIQNDKPIQEQMALAFVNLKLGLHEEGAKFIKQTSDTYPKEVYAAYPVRVFLKPSLFNPDDIQSIYRNSKNDTRSKTYQTIFYFAPYKVFNATQTLSDIQKGNANIFIDDMGSAKEYLEKSTRASHVDYGIALAIQKALDFRLREANVQLNNLLKANPQHSLLHYNLALTYAQMGDFSKAYEHFLRSYHLDANNYLSGIFAIMSSDLISKNNPKLLSILQDNLSKEPPKEEFELYRVLVDITQNNYQSAGKWLDSNYKERPLYLAMKVLIGLEAKQMEAAKKASERLVWIQKRDILPHLMYIDAHFKDQKPKSFAYSAINYLKKQPFRYDDLFFGPQITRERSVLMNVATGQLTPMIERLKAKLGTTSENTADITSALAQAYFYNRNFEEAYTLYNQLIDTYKIKDEQTLFLGACASIGAEHYENAIALLELSKLKNPNFMESRYALGLLYMQIQNYSAAVNQLNRMGNNGFVSRYFDFNIDTDKIAKEPTRYHPL